MFVKNKEGLRFIEKSFFNFFDGYVAENDFFCIFAAEKTVGREAPVRGTLNNSNGFFIILGLKNGSGSKISTIC